MKNTVVLNITMRKLEVLYSMFPKINVDKKSYTLKDFFDIGASSKEVSPSYQCKNHSQHVDKVSKYIYVCHVT